MKRKASFLIALSIITALMLSGCISDYTPNNGQPQATETPIPTVQPAPEPETTPVVDNIDILDQNDETDPDDQDIDTGSGAREQGINKEDKPSAVLAKLLPSKKGYKWVYNGFAEYGHELVLESIKEEKDKIIYSAKGEVFDMSDGESGMDFSLAVKYTVTSDALIQGKTGDMSMEQFDNIVLIKLPLEIGNSWTQKVKNKDGKEFELVSTIEKAELVDGKKQYTVTYKDKNSPYYEQRLIREGTGVVGYTRLFMTEEGNYEITYWLYEEASGYNK